MSAAPQRAYTDVEARDLRLVIPRQAR
jgi:hypothetical protein